MSYKCGLCGCQVEPGIDAIRVVTQVREVNYVNLDTKYPDKRSKGMEIAKEHIICEHCNWTKIGADFKPEPVGTVTREVHMTRSRRREEKDDSRREGSFRDFDL